MPGASGFVVVLVTAPRGDSERIARALVESRVAACVNIVGGVKSIYWWRGAVEEGEEDLLVIKTTVEALPRLKARLREVHPYEVPELVALPIVYGLEEYLEWVASEVRASGDGEPGSG